jgi:Flp pilus assembly protein TadG
MKSAIGTGKGKRVVNLSSVWRRLCRGDDGVAAIEFAFTAPILVLILVGIIQVASAFFTLNQMNWVAREAARGLAVGDLADVADAEAFVESHLISWALAGSSVNVVLPDPNDPNNTDYTVEIRVPLEDAALVDSAGYLTGKTVSAYSVMRDEQPTP